MQKVIQKSITIMSEPRHLDDVRRMLKEALAETPVSDRDKALIVLAVDEAVSSIVCYAGDKHLQNEVAVAVDIDDVRVKVVVTDSLNFFDLNGGLSERQFSDCVSRERQYKLGIFLIRSIMDEITYSYKKGFQNELELIRFL